MRTKASFETFDRLSGDELLHLLSSWSISMLSAYSDISRDTGLEVRRAKTGLQAEMFTFDYLQAVS